jgi:hypothetical protein
VVSQTLSDQLYEFNPTVLLEDEVPWYVPLVSNTLYPFVERPLNLLGLVSKFRSMLSLRNGDT